MWGKGKDRDWLRHGVKDRVNLLETVSRINVAFPSKISRDYPLYPIYLFFLLSYFFFNPSIISFFFNPSWEKGSRRKRAARSPWRDSRSRKKSKETTRILSKLHGLPVKIHCNDDYNARRGEIYCAENSRNTFAMHLIILKKMCSLSLPLPRLKVSEMQ